MPFVPLLAGFATALAHGSRYRAAPRRLILALTELAVLTGVWTSQIPGCWRALEQLALPGRSARALDYDEILQGVRGAHPRGRRRQRLRGTLSAECSCRGHSS